MEELIQGSVYWVGVIDWSLRQFHGYTVPDGATYNAYVIKDGDDAVVIDSVRESYYQNYLNKIKEVTDLKKIKYVISLHAEPDHSGSIQYLVQQNPNITVITSPKGQLILSTLHPDLAKAKFKTVQDNETLTVGRKTLKFILTPMQHWPESMMCQMDDILFSSDFYGQHLATTERWADEFDIQRIMMRVEDYIANIMYPFKKLITNTVKNVAQMHLDAILPAHGLCFRKDGVQIAKNLYASLVNGTHRINQVSIMYDTMYGSTGKAASVVAQGVLSKGFQPILMNLSATSNSEAAYQTYKSKAVALGSCTLNNQMMPNVEGVIQYLKSLNHLSGLNSVVFGACAWNANAVGQLKLVLKEGIVGEKQWVLNLSEKDLEDVYGLGQKLVGEIK